MIRDTYLRGHMDDQGFAPLRVIAGFKKVNLFSGCAVLYVRLIRSLFMISYFISKFITCTSVELHKLVFLRQDWELGWTCIQSNMIFRYFFVTFIRRCAMHVYSFSKWDIFLRHVIYIYKHLMGYILLLLLLVLILVTMTLCCLVPYQEFLLIICDFQLSVLRLFFSVFRLQNLQIVSSK